MALREAGQPAAAREHRVRPTDEYLDTIEDPVVLGRSVRVDVVHEKIVVGRHWHGIDPAGRPADLAAPFGVRTWHPDEDGHLTVLRELLARRKRPTTDARGRRIDHELGRRVSG